MFSSEYFPSLTYWEYVIFLTETISLPHLTSIRSPSLWKRLNSGRVSFSTPPTPPQPQSFSQEENMRVTLVPFSKCSLFFFLGKEEKKQHISFIRCWGGILKFFFFSCFGDVGPHGQLPSVKMTFTFWKKRSKPKLLKWHLIAPVFKLIVI